MRGEIAPQWFHKIGACCVGGHAASVAATWGRFYISSWIVCYLCIRFSASVYLLLIFQVSPQSVTLSSQSVRPRELHVGVSCRPRMPAVRGCMPYPTGGFSYPPQVPVNRPQCRPPFESAQRLFGPATSEPVFRPQALPEQCLQFHDASLSAPSLRFLSRPRMISPFQVPYGVDMGSCAFPRMECQPMVSCNRPSFFQAQASDNLCQSLKGLPCTSELNAAFVPVSSVGTFVQSSSKSVVNKQVTMDQSKESCAVSEPVQAQSQSVYLVCSKQHYTVPRNSDGSRRDRSFSSTYDEYNRQSRQRHRPRFVPRRHVSSQYSRQWRGDRWLHRDNCRFDSRPEKRWEFYVINAPVYNIL